MITDQLLRVSTNQAITATAVSTDKIDLGAGVRDVGAGKDLYMVFTVTETFLTLTSLALAVVVDNDAALGSPTVLASKSVTLAGGGLAAGQQHVLPIPEVIGSLGERYLGATYTVTGAAATAGKITTDIVETVQDGKKFYPVGWSVA